ncbi:hypothetical protein [Candidatus Nitrospira bockiana]
MTLDEARRRIESAIAQFGPHAGMAIDLIVKEVRGDHGKEAANDLIDEFDLELCYNIPPIESVGSGD